MVGKGNFENRLIAAAGEETLKKAKALLKSGAVVGAWRDRQGLLNGVFSEDGAPRTHVKVRTGDEMRGECPRCSEPLCRHAVALILHSGRFPFGEKSEAEPY